ncbi:MAG: hypothetical protein ORN98_00245 [Alphaproteobacteria bacterium]|nr:hypothetical protein [Alphaproteobacteria bacterium]
MTLKKPQNHAAENLLYQQIVRLEEAKLQITDAISVAYKIAKKNGINITLIRKSVDFWKIRRKDKNV